jgi:hydrogenase maturation protease
MKTLNNQSHMRKCLVVGLGNTVLSDDAVGIIAVRRAQKMLPAFSKYVDFKESCSIGFDMLYDMIGYDCVLIIDSIMTGACEPGTCLVYTMDDFDQIKQERIFNTHYLNLPTVFNVGHTFGYKIPEECILFGIESADVTTFSEELTEKVADSMEEIVKSIGEVIGNWLEGEAVVEDVQCS